MTNTDIPFWESKSLQEMTHDEWESLCDGCAKCCLVQLEDEHTSELVFTDVACDLLDAGTCRCTDYSNRSTRVPECMTLTPSNVYEAAEFAPPTCAYRLLAIGEELPEWHPLVQGNLTSTIESGNSVSTKVRFLRDVDPDYLEDYVVDWPAQNSQSVTRIANSACFAIQLSVPGLHLTFTLSAFQLPPCLLCSMVCAVHHFQSYEADVILSRWYWFGLIGSLLLLAVAYFYFQLELGLAPCPLCLIQRGALFAVAGFCLLGILFKPKRFGSKLLAFGITLSSLFGLAIAGRQVWLQSLPADQVPECGPDLAFMLEAFPFTEMVTTVLSGSGECAEVQWTFLSLSMPAWMVVIFTIMTIISLVLGWWNATD